jgi:hypothetical protein
MENLVSSTLVYPDDRDLSAFQNKVHALSFPLCFVCVPPLNRFAGLYRKNIADHFLVGDIFIFFYFANSLRSMSLWVTASWSVYETESRSAAVCSSWSV